MASIDLASSQWSRYTAEYVIDARFGRRDRLSDWRDRIDKLDPWLSGEWNIKKPDGKTEAAQPMVANTIRNVMYDAAHLSAEAVPSLRVPPEGDTQKALHQARKRMHAANTYWAMDDGDAMTEALVMDLLYTATCFLLSWVDKRVSDYPLHRVLNPRNCLPNFEGTRLIDLITVDKIPWREADADFPNMGYDIIPKGANPETEMVDVMTWYRPDVIVTAAAFQDLSNPRVVRVRPNRINRLTVAGTRMVTEDRFLRGWFDQLPGALQFQQNVMGMISDGAAKAVYGPTFVKGNVQNPEDDGPNALIIGDENSDMVRLQPAHTDPSVFESLQYAHQATGSNSFSPDSREGIVTQSIASNAFVQGTQGKLTSLVRMCCRRLEPLRKHQTETDILLDREYLDFEKALYLPVGKEWMYTPSKDLPEKPRLRWEYGMGAGLDGNNASVLLMQLHGNRMLSQETAMALDPNISDPEAEILKMDQEDVKGVIKQQLIQPQFAAQAAKVYAAMGRGESLVDAMTAVQEEMAAIQAQAQQPQAPGLPGPQGPEEIAAQAASLGKGGVPGGAPALQQQQNIPPPFAPPPLANVRV